MTGVIAEVRESSCSSKGQQLTLSIRDTEGQGPSGRRVRTDPRATAGAKSPTDSGDRGW